MAEGQHGPIKVGSGYVEIVPKVLAKDMAELRTKITSELEKIGVAASKEMKGAVTKGLAGLPGEVAKQAKKAKEATEKEALDSKKTLTRIAKELTKQYGKEAADRFKEAQKLEKEKLKLVEKTSSSTKKALRDVVASETRAAKDSAQRWSKAEGERAKLTQKRIKDSETAAKREQTDAEKTAKSVTRYNKMIYDAYAENERRKRKEAQQTASDQLKYDKMLYTAYAENERRKRKEAETTAREEKAYRVSVAQAYAENEKRNQAAIRETLRVQREAATQQVAAIRSMAEAERNTIRDNITAQRNAIRDTRGEIATLRRTMADSTTQASSYFKRFETGTKKMGTWFHEVGIAISEAGNILSTKFLAPLALAGAGLTAIGVTNADKRLLGQLGLSAAGVSKSQSANQMQRMQQYAIATPFSIDVMHEYQMKMIRSVAGADKDWYSPNAKTKTTAANKAADRTTDIIMAIGDSMSRAGNLSPDMFRRAMYAMDMIMDMDRAPTRNVKQLASSTGMPASELAQLLGFKNSTEMWKIIGTPAKDGGGVTGVQIANSMLNYWDPNKYQGRYKGEGSKGYAEKMTSETITGRIEQMKERSVFELGNMFVKEGKGGQYGYTKLGEKIMGKRVPVYKTDPKDGAQTLTGYRNEGGILNQVQDIAKKYAPDVEKFLGAFLDAVSKFVGMIDKVSGFLKETGLDKVAISVGKFLAEWGPMILAVGLITKLFGKVLKIGGALMAPARAAGRGVLRTYDAVNGSDVRERRSARSSARQAALDAGGSRRDARRAGRQASRDTRVQQTGDTRSAGRRVLDRVTGNNGSAQTDQLRGLEDSVRQAERRVAELQQELTDLNRTTMRQIADALGGSGNGNVTGAATTAQNAVNQVQTQVQQTNRGNLGQLVQEIDKVKKSADEAHTSLGHVHDKVNSINGEKLSKVHSEFSSLKTEADDAGKKITSANTRVGNLNGKDVKGVTASVHDLTKEAKRAADQIGDGAMSSSTSGRTANLNKRRLTDVIHEFKKLHDGAEKAFKMVGQGTGATSLAGRIGLLNGRSLSKIIGAVNDLAKALKKAKDEGDDLDGALDRIGKKSPGGGSSGGSTKKKKRARGGLMRETDVMPGYQPWADTIPTLLTPGEAVLRPEVANAIGEDKINTWNALAVRGKISRHARGTGSAGRMGLDQIRELIDLQNIAPIGTAMLKTMGMDATSDDLGGSTQGGILRTGDVSARFGGSVAADKFRDMYGFMTKDVFKLARRVPSLVGQIAGVLGGALSPTLGDYFWDDVWKGKGNIVDRGKAYMGDVFSTKTLGSVWDNLWGGVSESASAIWDTIQDPIGAFTGAFDSIGEIVSGTYNRYVGMVETVKEITQNPMEYASRVGSNFLDEAKDAMPNTKGLFDFDKGEKIKADIPDMVNSIVEPGSGKGVKRWAPVAKTAMGMLHMPASALGTVLHRIGVESGGNPGIVNDWDSNAKMGTPSVGLMQVIGPTFKRWAGPFAKKGPFKFGTSIDPLANIYAGLNYATHRYPNSWQSVLAGNKGYATGTLSASPGLAVVGERGRELVAFGGGERVFDNQETEGLLNGKKYEIHVHEARTEPTPQAVLRALQTAEALYTTL
jgi:SLT domain-containing protein